MSEYDAAVKTSGRYTLKIVHDDEPPNPREDCDNFGKMACWHSRYNLGDKHDHKNPDELLAELARRTLFDDDVISYVKDGKADGLKLEYNKPGREWELKFYDDYLKEWFTERTFKAPLSDNSTLLRESVLDNLGTRDLMNLAEKNCLIMPLYLYDHSILSISTDSFAGRAHHADWDSGQVGWTYASRADIAEEYGDASPANIEKARRLLTGETETYDLYLRGECYGFKLFKDGEETAGCWGFLGGFDEAKAAIREYIPEDAAALIDDTRYGDHDPEDEPTGETEDER
jgi:hypothetical protein